MTKQIIKKAISLLCSKIMKFNPAKFKFLNSREACLGRYSGFTIIEFLIAIVIISVLVVVTVVSYINVSDGARDVTLRVNLINSATQMQIYYIANGSYPSVLPSGVKYALGVGESLSYTGDSRHFCINGQISNGNSILHMFFNSSSDGVQLGACEGNVIQGSEHNIPKNHVPDGSFSNIGGTGWLLSTQSESNPLIKRIGISSDPIPNKPVLVVTNSVSRMASSVALQGPINYTSLLKGTPYKRSIWVRAVGNFVGSVFGPGVKDSNGLDIALVADAEFKVSTLWRKISIVSVASRDGVSGDLFYMPISASAFASTGWTLEFQNPQLVQQQ